MCAIAQKLESFWYLSKDSSWLLFYDHSFNRLPEYQQIIQFIIFHIVSFRQF
jgi:hypothetical protein